MRPTKLAVTLAINFFYMPLFAIGVLLAFRALDLLSRLQASGMVNDVSLVAAFALVLIALLLTWGLHEQRGTQPSALILVVCGAWVATAAVAYFLAIGRAARRAHPGHALLVLRVFDRTGRAQQFLDQLLVRWRLIGPVWQIGGPDLAPLNVSLLGSTMYLAGRLHELFLPVALTSHALERRLRRSPASDGRWGIDELFCFNSAWLGTVEQLMVISDAILIDLRGFTAERQGIREELVLLARTRRLSRTLAIGDERTDWTHVGRLVDATAGEGAQLLTKVTVAPGAELRCLAQLADISTRSRGTAESCS